MEFDWRIGILLLVIGGFLAFSFLIQPRKSLKAVRILEEKPTLVGKIIKNPDLIFSVPSEFRNKKIAFYNLTDTAGWSCDGSYYRGSIGGREGIVNIHPWDLKKGKYLEQEVFLPSGKRYVLNLGVADVAGRVYYAGPTHCDDVGIRVIIRDLENKSEDVIFDTVVNSLDGWRDFSIWLGSRYSGKRIKVRVESYAGGPCGDWAGEWAAVDYVDIIEV